CSLETKIQERFADRKKESKEKGKRVSALSFALAREKRKSRCAEIRSEEEEKEGFSSNKKGRCQRSPMVGEVHDGGRGKSGRFYIRFFRWKVQNRIRVTSVCPGPGGKHSGDRVKILSYFRMTGLGLVLRLALVDI
ncbi:hypothetical protein DBV15_05392, partial [Temnothorax longispinosus]